MELPKRKRMRLKNFDYSTPGAYFITICTKNKAKILSHIVDTGAPDDPFVQLTDYGKIAEKYINRLNNFYEYISVDRYVIMPNHIHLLIQILPHDSEASTKPTEHGPSRTPVPTVQNSITSQLVSTFKRFCNKEYGKNIWQYRSHDHVIRGRTDYNRIAKYIYENPMLWQFDCFYSE